MESFKNWIKKKGLVEDFTDKFKFNNDPDVAGDYEQNVKELGKLLLSQYSSDFDNFITRLSNERGDQRLKSLYGRCKTDGSSSVDPWSIRRSREQDEIVPPEADKGAAMQGAP